MRSWLELSKEERWKLLERIATALESESVPSIDDAVAFRHAAELWWDNDEDHGLVVKLSGKRRVLYGESEPPVADLAEYIELDNYAEIVGRATCAEMALRLRAYLAKRGTGTTIFGRRKRQDRRKSHHYALGELALTLFQQHDAVVLGDIQEKRFNFQKDKHTHSLYKFMATLMSLEHPLEDAEFADEYWLDKDDLAWLIAARDEVNLELAAAAESRPMLSLDGLRKSAQSPHNWYDWCALHSELKAEILGDQG